MTPEQTQKELEAKQSRQAIPDAKLNEYLYQLCNGRFVYNNRNEELDFTDPEQMRAAHATLMYLYQESRWELQVKNGKDYPLFD